ncbi:5-(carboxyamino)imidazole ribonucleotide synthase [Rickettsiales bacterium]|nr:5-(carboxyamino)imidazole ribonucleotide synthase [Rickettsiales bacterium]
MTNLIIGIFGGGQLGDMISCAAKNIGCKTIIFTDDPDSPAIKNADDYIISDYNDRDNLKIFAKKIDVATLEFENIPPDSVDFIENFCPIFPNSRILNIAKDRFLEKSFMIKNNIKTARFFSINNQDEFLDGLLKFNYQAILKTNQMGYDGKGQFVIKDKNNIPKIDFNKIDYILEEFIPFEKEISIMIGRNQGKNIACYEPLENKHKNGILDISSYPANISDEVKNNAQLIAQRIIENLDMIGLLGVEFFVLENGELLVNEIAPRPHNSGHFSMDSSKTSQFEQLIRIICKLPLGDTKFYKKGYMKNLIGDDILKIDNITQGQDHNLYLYNKKHIKPGRKMGHINFFNL